MATPPKKPGTRRPRKPADETPAAGTDTGTETPAEGAAAPDAAADAPKTPRRRAAAKAAAPAPATRRKSSARKTAATGTARDTAAKASGAAKRARDKSPFGLKTAIAAGIGAVGAVATAALLTLRSSTPRDTPALPPPADDAGAHQADGTDASRSFEAGIADEGTIPNG